MASLSQSVGIWSVGLADTLQGRTQRMLSKHSQQIWLKPFGDKG